MNRRKTLKTIAASACWVGAGGLFGACSSRFHGLDITGADYGKDFQLTDFNGQPRTLADFKGKVVVMFFGYVQCPDVCPTTLLQMAQLKQRLGADGGRLQVLFVSVDPERDTPQVLRAYMDSFDPTFLALYTASPQQLAELARDYRVIYRKVPGKTPGSYSMDHTAASYIYDPQGRLRLQMRYGMALDDLEADVKLLLQGA